MRHIAAILAAIGLLTDSATSAAQQEPWQFEVTPYLWLPYVDANLGFEAGGSGGSTVDMSNLLKHLSGALFVNAAARKGRWGLSFDLVYCDFSKASSKVTNVNVPGLGGQVPVNAGTTSDLTGYLLSLEGSYALVRSSRASLDVVAGLRYTHIGATLNWSFSTSIAGLPARTGSAGTGVELWEGVVGASGHVTLADRAWFVPFYLDVGTGTADFTWQGLVGVGYAFRWGDVLVVYRYLTFSQAGEGDMRRLTFYGPALGATFRF